MWPQKVTRAHLLRTQHIVIAVKLTLFFLRLKRRLQGFRVHWMHPRPAESGREIVTTELEVLVELQAASNSHSTQSRVRGPTGACTHGEMGDVTATGSTAAGATVVNWVVRPHRTQHPDGATTRHRTARS